MILIGRAPVRISFGGGGTDLPAYYEQYGGLVISTTVAAHTYAILTQNGGSGLQIICADYRCLCAREGIEDPISGTDLSLPKAITDYFNVHQGLTIFLASQIPPGSGLGTFASTTVAMVKALAFWCGLDLAPAQVAELACDIAIEKLGMPVGKQDQYAAAFGGLNQITFTHDGVGVEPLSLPPEARKSLEQNLMVFSTGTAQQPYSILRQQSAACLEQNKTTTHALHKIKEYAVQMRSAIEAADMHKFGELLHLSWEEKRRVASGITSPFLDACYLAARDQGAVGGKVAGAGGGGCLVLYCPSESQPAVSETLKELGLKRQHFTTDHEGVQVLHAQAWNRATGIPSPVFDQRGLNVTAGQANLS